MVVLMLLPMMIRSWLHCTISSVLVTAICCLLSMLLRFVAVVAVADFPVVVVVYVVVVVVVGFVLVLVWVLVAVGVVACC